MVAFLEWGGVGAGRVRLSERRSCCDRRIDHVGRRVVGGRRTVVMAQGFPPPKGPGEDGGLIEIALGVVAAALRTFQSPNGQLFLFGFTVYLVLSGNFGFVLNTVFFLFAAVVILPVIGLFVFRFFVSKNLIEVSVR